MALGALLRPRSLLNPVGRLAMATFAWNHRHEILRWGRSLYVQLMHGDRIAPGRAARVAAVLFAVASDPSFRNARELRRVTLDDDGTVDLEVDETWPQLPRLVERVRKTKGVRAVVVNGAAVRDIARRVRATAS